MHEIIDVARDIGPLAERLAAAGVKTVLRYYNHRNGPNNPTKGLTRRELDQLQAAGLDVAVVFQQRGGADGHLGDLSAANGTRDAQRALDMAAAMGQPAGSAIYFAVDHDYFRTSELSQVESYFRAVRAKLAGAFLCGVYGSGTIGRTLRRAGLVDYVWLAAATGWSGTRQALEAGEWTLFQKYLERTSEVGGFIYDGNIVNPAFGSFGQFGPSATAFTGRGLGVEAQYRIAARSGLNLRSGPGEDYRVIQSVAPDTIVAGLGRDGRWMQVDLDGDRRADGYMFASFLRSVSGGLPLALPGPLRPFDVARAELALDVTEIPGSANNPRIVLYHSTTQGDAAENVDETAWCSSFVNYCVEQAGFSGTDSKWARDWHESDWGSVVTDDPEEGDIVVWRRVGAGDDGGHVGFFVNADASGIQVLGGNQSDRVRIQRYPRNGTLDPYTYTLLSIRRPG
jgi:uncharacterized protein (TIGR02594 family)